MKIAESAENWSKNADARKRDKNYVFGTNVVEHKSKT
jgi:hypothetical protein